MKNYIVWGGTGHARVVHELVTATGDSVAVVVDNANIKPPLEGVPLLRGQHALEQWLKNSPGTYLGVAAIGSKGKDRLEILKLLQSLGLETPSLHHSTAFVASTAHVGEGSHVLAKSCLCAHAQLGRGVIINTGSIVDHDGILEDGCHIAPGVTLAGQVHIGPCCFIGAGTTILPRITIGKNSIIGAGSVVTHDIGDNVVALGSPAKVVRTL